MYMIVNLLLSSSRYVRTVERTVSVLVPLLMSEQKEPDVVCSWYGRPRSSTPVPSVGVRSDEAQIEARRAEARRALARRGEMARAFPFDERVNLAMLEWRCVT